MTKRMDEEEAKIKIMTVKVIKQNQVLQRMILEERQIRNYARSSDTGNMGHLSKVRDLKTPVSRRATMMGPPATSVCKPSVTRL